MVKESKKLLTVIIVITLIVLAASYVLGRTHKGVEVALPRALASYNDGNISDLSMVFKHRIHVDPFNLISTLIFIGAIIHTFIAGYFTQLSRKIEKEHRQEIESRRQTATQKPYVNAKDDVSFLATVFHFLGEIEVIFALWAIPLGISMALFYNWSTLENYLNHSVNYLEAIFVVVIMAIASTRPVIKFAENILAFFAQFGNKTPGAWWISILILAPMIGSFITEPAAMTIGALLLSRHIYRLNPSKKLAYATIGLLFVNVSVGGTFSHFAAPPILMVADAWNLDFWHVNMNYGWQALTGILVSTSVYYLIFRKEFQQLSKNAQLLAQSREKNFHAMEEPIPFWVSFVHILFLAWTVFNLHNISLFVGGFLFFIAFMEATGHFQDTLMIRRPLLVGLFLAGLVIHGTLQQWWLEPLLSSLGEIPLFLGATILTAFNDNAAITYLASLVPAIKASPELQHAVLSGALAGGGLTVIANAPNPAGRALLNEYFENGLSPLGLFLGALIPTVFVCLSFTLLS